MSLDMGMQLHQAGLVRRATLQLLTFDNNLRYFLPTALDLGMSVSGTGQE